MAVSVGYFDDLVRDGLAARAGDSAAAARLARTVTPRLLKSVLPGNLVDAGVALYDHVAKPELVPAHATAPARATFDGPGARRFRGWLRGLDHGVIAVIGATGSGKTTLMAAIADRWETASHRYMVGVPPKALESTPLEPFEWRPEAIAKLPAHSVLLVPDAGHYLDARDWGSDAEETVRELVAIARHRDVRIVLDCQYTAQLARSALLVKALIYKGMGVTWEILERDGLRKLAAESQAAFAALPLAEWPRHAYVFCDEANFRGLVSYERPDWYSLAISKAHGAPNGGGPAGVVEGEFVEVGPEGRGLT